MSWRERIAQAREYAKLHAMILHPEAYGLSILDLAPIGMRLWATEGKTWPQPKRPSFEWYGWLGQAPTFREFSPGNPGDGLADGAAEPTAGQGCGEGQSVDPAKGLSSNPAGRDRADR